MSASGDPFALHLGDLPAFRVHSFTGHEELSQLYAFEITASAADADAQIDRTILGRQAALAIDLPGGTPRAVHGIITAVEGEDAVERGFRTFHLRLVPTMALLEQRVDTRIFQDRTVAEIVATVLGRYPIPHEFRLAGALPRRAYSVQYAESDLAFVTRLLAEAGLFFWFEHPVAEGCALEDVLPTTGVASELLIITDSQSFYGKIVGDDQLVFRAHTPGAGPGAMVVEEHHVTRFHEKSVLAPSAVALRDYDFTRPLLDLTSTVSARSLEPTVPVDLEIYDHHGEYEETDVSPAHAAVQLEQHTARAATHSGESACRRLSPGAVFSLSDHPIERANGRHVVTRVQHKGVSPHMGGHVSYESRFSTAAPEIPVRPPRPPRQIRQVMETAIVVGPEGQEIFTDAYGRVKVRFHWDREEHGDQLDSCFLRVAQAWAGASWGFQFIPRVGMEVVVTFLGGDPDRPLITGCVYNALNPPSHLLPVDAARSGIRTRTLPGGEGFNELAFDDKRGAEQVYLRAQRNLDEVVLVDHTTHVGKDQSTVVEGDQSTVVSGTRSVQVDGTQTVSARGSAALSVGGEHSISVGGDERHEVKGNRLESVSGVSTAQLKSDALTLVVGDHALRVEGDSSTQIGNIEKHSSGEVYAYGDYDISAGRTVRLRAITSIILESGDNKIIVSPEGITLQAGTISIKAGETATMSGKGPTLTLGDDAEIAAKTVSILSSGASIVLKDDAKVHSDKITLESKQGVLAMEDEAKLSAKAVKLYSADKASVELDQNASMKGALVMLNCKGDAGDKPGDEKDKDKKSEEEKVERKKLSLRLLDPKMEPYKDKNYVLVVAGERFEGKSDGDGKLEQEVRKEAEMGSLILWTGEYPTGERVTWKLSIQDEAPAADVAGCLVRLRNLGYYLGPMVSTVDERLRSAIVQFQVDHELEGTGELDGKTLGKLNEIHGH
jgi:type VI secretion system secreted protein VgrG